MKKNLNVSLLDSSNSVFLYFDLFFSLSLSLSLLDFETKNYKELPSSKIDEKYKILIKLENYKFFLIII